MGKRAMVCVLCRHKVKKKTGECGWLGDWAHVRGGMTDCWVKKEDGLTCHCNGLVCAERETEEEAKKRRQQEKEE